MALMSSFELLAIAAVLLANGQIGCMWAQMSARPGHPIDGARSGTTAALLGGLGEEVGDERPLVVVGNRWEPAVAVVVAVGRKGRGASNRGKLGEGVGECLGASSTWARDGQERRVVGRACCPGRRILGPNLRPKWVRADAFGQLCLFGLSRWANSFVRTDVFRHAVSVWVGPLEMPLESFNHKHDERWTMTKLPPKL
jgi:hypothetical protein